ncbi:MAG: HAMP domain-containing protein [Bacteroidetes bacterium]|nr:HAMP domain-containing protein [Bacteroidota bacterium]
MILGYISFNQANRLWQNTDDLYNHPYQVGRTVRDIQIGVLEIHRKMKDIAMDEGLTYEQINKIVHEIDSIELNVYENYGLVKQFYLGPKEDIDKSYMSFSSWKRVRDNLIDIRLKSGRDEAYKTYIGVNRAFVNSIIPEINRLIQFSSAKGETFYEQAGIEKDKLFARFIILVLIIVFSTVFITFLLIRGIRSPLRNLTSITDEYSRGNYSVRSDYISENEFGMLASAFNKMAFSVQNDIIIKENVAWVTHLLMNEE